MRKGLWTCLVHDLPRRPRLRILCQPCEVDRRQRTIPLLGQRPILLVSKPVTLLRRRLAIRPHLARRQVARVLTRLVRLVLRRVLLLLELQLVVRLRCPDRSGPRTRVQPVLRVHILACLLLISVQDSLSFARDRIGTFIASSSLIRQDLARIEHLVHDFVEGLVPAHKLVVELGVSRGVDPTEVLHAAVLVDGLSDEVPVAQHGAALEQVGDLEVLALVLLNELVDEEFDLRVLLKARDEQVVCSCLRDWY